MSIYLKKFQQHSEYEAFTGTSAYIHPNVSLCEVQEEVHYDITPPAISSVTANNSATTNSAQFYCYYDGSNYELAYPYVWEKDYGGICRPSTITSSFTVTISGSNFSDYTIEMCKIGGQYHDYQEYPADVTPYSSLGTVVQTPTLITIPVNYYLSSSVPNPCPSSATGIHDYSYNLGIKISGLGENGGNMYILIRYIGSCVCFG